MVVENGDGLRYDMSKEMYENEFVNKGFFIVEEIKSEPVKPKKEKPNEPVR